MQVSEHYCMMHQGNKGHFFVLIVVLKQGKIPVNKTFDDIGGEPKLFEIVMMLGDLILES